MTIIEEAEQLIVGERADSYGDSKKSFEGIALVWSGILKKDITAEEVALCMAGLKLVRESATHKRDNLVDIIGYTLLLNKLHDAETDN